LKIDISMRKTLLFSGIAAIVILTISLIFLYNSFLDISYSHNVSYIEENPDQRPVVYFGVVSRYSPHLLYEGYQPLMDYLSNETSYQFRLRLSHTYQETIEQLNSGQVSAAFLGTYIYILNRDNSNLQCFLKPLNKNGEPFFHSVVVALQNSGINTIEDLKGKRLALPSPHSYSANWLFKDTGLKQADMDSIYHFDFHNTVIYEILKGDFDAGIVKDRVAREFEDKGIRIIQRSDSIPASPIVIHKRTAPEIAQAISEALLKIDIKQDEYKKLVQSWDPEFRYGFITAAYQDYPNEMSAQR